MPDEASSARSDSHTRPSYKALVRVEVVGEKTSALTDSGCSRTCCSEDFIRNHPTLKDHEFKPYNGKTISIDGSPVNTIGVVNLTFKIGNQEYRSNCRVIRNLVYDFVLGWDFLFHTRAKLNAYEGLLEFPHEKVPLVPNTIRMTSAHFCMPEGITLPAKSKAVIRAAIKVDPIEAGRMTNTVISQPLLGQSARVAVTNGIHKVEGGSFITEILNPFSSSLTVDEGTILGTVEFVDEGEIAAKLEETEITIEYHEEQEPEAETAAAAETLPKRQEDTLPPPNFNYEVAEDAKEYLPQLKHLLEEKHTDAFTRYEFDAGRTNLMEHHVSIKPGPPIVCRQYRTSPEHTKIIEKHVHEMLANNMVSHSTSPYSAPVMLCPKKDGGYRFVADFRKLNARCERQIYPLPRIEDSLRRLSDPKFFSCLDLQKGFWQVPVVEEDRKYFAFSAGSMHVHYNVMPMVALNSSSTLQALMTLLLRGLPPEHIICFLDDVLIASSTMEQHLQHIDLVLTAIRRAGLKLNPKKCLFARDAIVSLGHKVSRDGIGPDPNNLDKIKKWKPPTNRTEVRQFTGLTGYYRQMIKGYAKNASPLTELTKNDFPSVPLRCRRCFSCRLQPAARGSSLHRARMA